MRKGCLGCRSRSRTISRPWPTEPTSAKMDACKRRSLSALRRRNSARACAKRDAALRMFGPSATLGSGPRGKQAGRDESGRGAALGLGMIGPLVMRNVGGGEEGVRNLAKGRPRTLGLGLSAA